MQPDLSVKTIAGYVEISQQLLDDATLRFGWVNHRTNRSQRSRRRAYRRAPIAAALFTHVEVPTTWPKDWRYQALRRAFSGT